MPPRWAWTYFWKRARSVRLWLIRTPPHIGGAGALELVRRAAPADHVDGDDDVLRSRIVGKGSGDQTGKVLVEQDGWPASAHATPSLVASASSSPRSSSSIAARLAL